ncbi:MAG: DoxX family protein, partial [Gallionella sp.]
RCAADKRYTFDGIKLFSLLGFAGALELVGGLLILIGLFTRTTAFILSGEMAVAYFMAHAANGLLPILNQGELAVVYCFVFLYFSVAGAGDFSIETICCKACNEGQPEE